MGKSKTLIGRAPSGGAGLHCVRRQLFSHENSECGRFVAEKGACSGAWRLSTNEAGISSAGRTHATGGGCARRPTTWGSPFRTREQEHTERSLSPACSGSPSVSNSPGIHKAIPDPAKRPSRLFGLSIRRHFVKNPTKQYLTPDVFPYCWMFESPGSPSPGKLKYAYMDLAGWHITAVDSTEGDNWHMGLYSCLKLDACDRPHISYVDEEQAWTKYATEVMLRGVLAGDSLALSWSPVAGAAEYWVYGADNEQYFVPGMTAPYAHRIVELPTGTTTWSTSVAVADPAHNWTYLVIPVDGSDQPLCVTNRVGEFDFDADTP